VVIALPEDMLLDMVEAIDRPTLSRPMPAQTPPTIPIKFSAWWRRYWHYGAQPSQLAPPSRRSGW
jgi:hypothetical protein